MRSAMLGLRDCLPSIFRSTMGALGVEILRYLMTLRFSSYWLVKVELTDMIGEIDFVLVHYLEQEKQLPSEILSHIPTTPLSFPQRNRPLSQFNGHLQEIALETILQLLCDEDRRVRLRAAEGLVRVAARLFFEEDWPGQDALAAAVERKAAYLAGVATSISWFGDGEGNFRRETHLDVPRANLSRIINMLVHHLRNSQSKHVLAGCYLGLETLISSSSLPMEVRYVPGSDSIGNPAVYIGDILPMAVNHLSLSSVLLDTALHVNIMSLLSCIVKQACTSLLGPYFTDLLQHILRTLNICVHIVEERVPSSKEARADKRQADKTNSVSKRLGGANHLCNAMDVRLGWKYFAYPHSKVCGAACKQYPSRVLV